MIQSFNELRTFPFLAGGKTKGQLILPLNSSLSVTRDKKEVIDLFTPTVTSSSTWEIRGLVSTSTVLTDKITSVKKKQQINK